MRRGIIIAIISVILLFIVGIVGTILTSSSNDVVDAMVASDDGSTIGVDWQKKENKASKKASETLYDGQTMIFDPTTLEIRITLTGMTSGKVISGSNQNGIISAVSGLFSEITVEGNNFRFNASTFEAGETVMVKGEFCDTRSVVDIAFGKGITTRFWAFTSGETQVPQNPQVPSSSGNSGTPANPGTSTPSGSAPTVNAGTTNTGCGSIYFNGFPVNVYSSRDVAIAAPISIGTDAYSCNLRAVMNDDIARVRVWTENSSGTSHGDEFFLYSDSDWSSNMDLSAWAGQTIIIAIGVGHKGTVPTNDYYYFAANVQ